MSKKLLTEELILKKLEEKGIKEPGTFEIDDVVDDLLSHYGAEIRDDWSGSCNIWFYTESTTDGYEVYVATKNQTNPSICEDLYYYESDWLEKLPNAIYDGLSIHLDNFYRDDYAFQDAINEVYDAYWNDQKKEIANGLIDEGYKWKNQNKLPEWFKGD